MPHYLPTLDASTRPKWRYPARIALSVLQSPPFGMKIKTIFQNRDSYYQPDCFSHATKMAFVRIAGVKIIVEKLAPDYHYWIVDFSSAASPSTTWPPVPSNCICLILFNNAL